MKIASTAVLAMSVAAALPCFADVLDEGEWPAVKPEFVEVPPRTVNGRYFGGKMIKSPKDQRGSVTNRFLLRRDFTLKAKPVEAVIQFVSDDGAFLHINGKWAARNNTWNKPTVADVLKFLKQGENFMELKYRNGYSAGGNLAELFVRYGDGSYERIETDSAFKSSIDGGKTWEGVVEQAVPPAKPWKYVRRLKYLDFAHQQSFLGGKVETADPVAGKPFAASFSFKGPLPEFPLFFDVKIGKGGGDYWIEEKKVGREAVRTGADGEWILDVNMDLPLYLSAGTYDLAVESGGFFCAGDVAAKVPFTCRSAGPLKGYESAQKADVRMVAGSPQVHLDGKPFFALWGGVAQRNRPDRRPRHSSAPLSLVTVYCSCEEWWPSVDGFDPAAFDRQAERYRRENGDDARFMWDLTLYPPADWFKANPDDECTDDLGNKVRDGRPSFSFASKSALDAMEKVMVKAIRYLESAPYANRIIGYRINSGHTIEWLGWDTPPGRMVDYSPATQTAFAEYLKSCHPDWTDAHIPTPAERASSDPAAVARNAAYYDFYSRTVADDIIRLMRKAREVSAGGRLFGTYYGYVMTMHSTGKSQIRAHYALKHLLDAKVVDYLMSPQAYSVRRLGDTCGDMKPFATLAANGVIPVIEDDTRTSVGPYNGNNHQVHTREQTVGVVRRNAGIALCRREPVYFYALCEGTEFDYPEFAVDMDAVRKVGEWSLAKKSERRAEVAYVVSEEDIKRQPFPTAKGTATGKEVQRYQKDGSVMRTKLGAIPGYGDVFQLNYTTLARAGAPVDYVLAEDLKGNPGKYKLVIMSDLPAGKLRFKTAAGEEICGTLLEVDALHEAYRKAGVHVYCESDDPMEANGSLFTFHARRAGRKTVRLPSKATVVDVFNRRVVAKDVDSFSFDAPLHSSWLFYFADDAEELLKSL